MPIIFVSSPQGDLLKLLAVALRLCRVAAPIFRWEADAPKIGIGLCELDGSAEFSGACGRDKLNLAFALRPGPVVLQAYRLPLLELDAHLH